LGEEARLGDNELIDLAFERVVSTFGPGKHFSQHIDHARASCTYLFGSQLHVC
jgi:hypothetical protein